MNRFCEEAVNVERVPINRVVAAPESARRENGVLIIPLYEETLVVEKRLVLVEELRITIEQTTQNASQTVALRREEAHIENLPANQSGEAHRRLIKPKQRQKRKNQNYG